MMLHYNNENRMHRIMKSGLSGFIFLSAVLLTACSEKMNHSQHMANMTQQDTSGMPTEAGQSSFAAIAEIVNILSSNPDTDWSKVNINALREHLLDMNNLMIGANVKEVAIDNGMRFEVTGEANVLGAIKRMVPAHSKELNKMKEYDVSTKNIDGGIAMTVTTNNEATTHKIKGLGFFGLMATGSHHQPHHLMMATGQGHMMHH